MNKDEEYEMVTSAEELMGRLRLADEQKLSLSSEQPDSAILLLGLPPPSDVSNAELEHLKPLYFELIKDIRKKKENSVYLSCLFERKRDEPQDSAMLMLYVLDYPGSVRGARADVSGLAGRTNKERFQLVDIADEIAADATIGNWCRTSIREHETYHASVLASSLSLLKHAVDRESVPRSQAKKIAKNIVFEGQKDSRKGFAKLRTDLAKLVHERTDLQPQAVVNTVTLQLHSLAALYKEETASDIMMKASGKEPFERALARIQHVLGPGNYQAILTILGAEMSLAEAIQVQTMPTFQATKTEQIVVCNRKGCSKQGTYRCSKCKLVSYCSKECQVADWKVGGHKQDCQGKMQSTTAVAPQKPSSALLKQERLLAQHLGQVDYIIDMPTGNQDVGVQFGHAMGKVMFKILRQKAPESPHAVYKMYDMLYKNNPGLESIIRRQLEREYGIDPLSEEAKNAPRGDIDEEDLQLALASL